MAYSTNTQPGGVTNNPTQGSGPTTQPGGFLGYGPPGGVAPSANRTMNSQIIGGYDYNIGSPEWYAAMRAENTAASGAAGTAAGTYTNNYMNTAFPSLAGLTGAAGNAALGAVGAGGVGGASAAGTMGGSAGTGGPVSAGSGVGPMQMPDMTQSNNAIFAAAKDKVGQTTRASLNSLNAELGAQGMLGGGAQSEATRDVINSGMGALGQTDRDLASQNASTALDVAKTNYGGSITQRGQDIQAQQANAQLALEQRQQNFQLLNTILNSLGRAPAGAAGPAPGMAY